MFCVCWDALCRILVHHDCPSLNCIPIWTMSGSLAALTASRGHLWSSYRSFPATLYKCYTMFCICWVVYAENYQIRPVPMAHSSGLGLVTWRYQVRRYRFESRSGWIFVIVVVHIQCSKLFKDLQCTLLSMVLCTIKNT